MLNKNAIAINDAKINSNIPKLAANPLDTSAKIPTNIPNTNIIAATPTVNTSHAVIKDTMLCKAAQMLW